jgi:hypothetical protein
MQKYKVKNQMNYSFIQESFLPQIAQIDTV